MSCPAISVAPHAPPDHASVDDNATLSGEIRTAHALGRESASYWSSCLQQQQQQHATQTDRQTGSML